MQYSIFDTGSLVGSFDNEGEAMNVLVALATADPARAGGLVFVAFDDDGERIGAPVLGSYLCGD